jgi:large subunit ribosomal protein MRP49
VRATEEEKQQIKELQEQREKSEKDAELSRIEGARRKREAAILVQARGELDAAREA